MLVGSADLISSVMGGYQSLLFSGIIFGKKG